MYTCIHSQNEIRSKQFVSSKKKTNAFDANKTKRTSIDVDSRQYSFFFPFDLRTGTKDFLHFENKINADLKIQL